MLLVVRIYSVNQFCCSGVLSAIFCLLVRGVGLLLVIVAFLITTVKFVSLELLLCKILFDLFLAEGTFCFMSRISCSSMECQNHEMLSFQYLTFQVTTVILVTIVC